MLKLFKPAMGIAVGLLLLMSSAAQAAISPASVLAINTDTSNSKLYVEISYVGRPCLIYQLKFGVGVFRGTTLIGDTTIAQPFKVVTGAGDAVVWRIDEDDDTNPTHNNPMPANGYITKVNGDVAGNNDTLMYDMQISGYRLEFDLSTIDPINLGARVLPTDSIKVCLRSQMKPIKCVGCGTAGTDRMFSLNDIATDCPYDYDNKEDMIACYHRDSKVQNWEGWIADARDCKKYRIVQMPDGKWWMAQNLNFQGTAGSPLKFQPNSKAPSGTAGIEEYIGVFWCPDSITAPLYSFADTSPQERDGNLLGCETYGALYTYASLALKNGVLSSAWGPGNGDLMGPVPFGDSTLISGICPEGWFVPSAQHWGKMINLLEKENDTAAINRYGCTETGANSAKRTGYLWLAGTNRAHYNPCMHLVDTATTQDDASLQRGWHASQYAYKDLLGTNVAPYREMDTVPNYVLEVDTITHDALRRNRRLLAAPKELRRFATVTNPVWSYFYPESAGTDKYGFSILPAGMRMNSSGYTYFGEYAIFWTSTSRYAKDALSTTYNLCYAFRYNFLLNHLMPHAVYSGNIHRRSGAPVRCIASNSTN